MNTCLSCTCGQSYFWPRLLLFQLHWTWEYMVATSQLAWSLIRVSCLHLLPCTQRSCHKSRPSFNNRSYWVFEVFLLLFSESFRSPLYLCVLLHVQMYWSNLTHSQNSINLISSFSSKSIVLASSPWPGVWLYAFAWNIELAYMNCCPSAFQQPSH